MFRLWDNMRFHKCFVSGQYLFFSLLLPYSRNNIAQLFLNEAQVNLFNRSA